jgi:integrase
LERYGNWLAAHRADRTAYMEITLLKSVNRWLIEQKLLPGDAKLSMSLHKPTGTDTYCYSRDEVAAMIQHCKRKRRLGWLGHVIVALSHTGLRISELAGLRWTDLNLAKNMLRVADERGCARKVRAGTARTTKGRRSRAIPIHPHLKQVLVGLKHSSDGYVFHAQQGGRLHSRNVLEAFISKVIEPLKKRFPTAEGDIGFEHGRLHSFRHFFCSQAFLGGASEGEIREWLGHKESAMVEHYRHLRGEDAQRKMAQIEFVDRRDEQRGDVA